MSKTSQINIKKGSHSCVAWKDVGLVHYDFQSQWGGDYIHLFTAIPFTDEEENRVLIEDCCKEIALWLMQNRSRFSSKDRFQIGVFCYWATMDKRKQVAKTGGGWKDIRHLSKGKLRVKFFPQWHVWQEDSNTN